MKLRVVEEESSATEEVLRLDGGNVVPVGRLKLPPVPEKADKLSADKPEFNRRTHEPGVDELIEDFVEQVDPEEQWKEVDRRKAVPYGWFVLILVFIMAAVAGGLWWGGVGEEEVQEVREEVRQRVEVDVMAEQEAIAFVETIEAGLRDYTIAHDVDSLMRHVRDVERVGPLMVDWYSRHEPGTPDFVRMGGMAPVMLGGHEFWQVVYENEAGKSRKVLMAIEDGVAKVDWETDVCYQPLEWDEYVKRLPEGAALDFRVQYVPDMMAFYSHEFQNENLWHAYQLGAMGSDEYLIGYVRRGGELDGRLTRLFESNAGNPVSAVLRLRRPSGTKSPRGVVIEEMISENWVIIREEEE